MITEYGRAMASASLGYAGKDESNVAVDARPAPILERLTANLTSVDERMAASVAQLSRFGDRALGVVPQEISKGEGHDRIGPNGHADALERLAAQIHYRLDELGRALDRIEALA